MATTSESRQVVKYLIVAIALLALLAAVLLGYWQLTRPASLQSESSTKDRNFLFSIYGFEGDLLRRPSSVTVGPDDNIYVADTGKHRVVVFDDRGRYQSVFGDPGQGQYQLQNPIDVAVATDGSVFVLDKGLKKIVKYDPDHRPVKEQKFDDWPISITTANNRLFVTMPPGVVVFDENFKPVTGYLSWGKEKGKFDKPGGVAVDEDGNLYVADSFNYRVQAISKQGKVLWSYGEPIPPEKAIQFQGEARKFGLPASITRDDNGNLYVVDGVNSELVMLNKDGEFIQKIGDVGHDDGTFYYPDGIDYYNGKLVVADKFNDRVEVFNVPRTGVAAFIPSAPWLLIPLLLLAGLIAWWLLRRDHYVPTPDFVGRLAADSENGADVAAAVKRLFVAEDMVETYKGMTDYEIGWKSHKFDAQKVQDIQAAYDVKTEDALALAIALGIRGKKLVLAEDPKTLAAAKELDVAAARYDELVDALAPEEPETPAPAPTTRVADAE